MEKELTSEERQHKLRESFQKKVQFLIAKKALHEDEVRELVRSLFKEWIGLDFEFTYEEAQYALDASYFPEQIKSKLYNLLQEMNLKEFYQDREQTEEELLETVKCIQEIIPDIFGEGHQKKDIISKLIDKLKLPLFRQGPKMQARAAASTVQGIPAGVTPEFFTEPAIEQEEQSSPGWDIPEAEDYSGAGAGNIPQPAAMPAGSGIVDVDAKEKEDFSLPQDIIGEQDADMDQEPHFAEPSDSGFSSDSSYEFSQEKPQSSQAAQEKVQERPQSLSASKDLMIEDTSGNHLQIYTMLEMLYTSIDKNNIDDARRIYNDILKFYHPLPASEKSKYYDVLYQVYQKLSAG